MKAGWDWFVKAVTDGWNYIKTTNLNTLEAVGKAFSDAWDWICKVFSEAWNFIKTTNLRSLNAIRSAFSDGWNFIKTTNLSTLNSISSAFSSAWSFIKTTNLNTINSIGSAFSSGWNFIKSTTSTTWTGIKTAILTPIEEAKKKIGDLVAQIKSFFNFRLSWPSLHVPKVTISWDTNGAAAAVAKALGMPGVPKFSITWAAQGGMLNSMQLIGAGEAGRELLLPLDQHTGWMDALADRVFARVMSSNQTGGGDISLSVNYDGELIYRSVVSRAQQERRRTGLAPIPV